MKRFDPNYYNLREGRLPCGVFDGAKPDPLELGWGAEALLKAFEAHLHDNGVGTISEIFDAEPPHVGRGCIAQAWSVAEVFRAMMESKTPTGLPPPKE